MTKYKLHLLLLLSFFVGLIASVDAQNLQTGDLAYGGIVVDHNTTTKMILIMSLDEIGGVDQQVGWLDTYNWAKGYRSGNYLDWDLPTIDELTLIYQKKDELNAKLETKLSPSIYSTSTQYNTFAWMVNLENGYVKSVFGQTHLYARAVRVINTELNYQTKTSSAIVNSTNSSITNSIIYHNLNGDASTESVIDNNGTITYTAAKTALTGTGNKVAKNEDFRDIEGRNFKLNKASSLRDIANIAALGNDFPLALNGVERVHKGKSDLGAYQMPLVYITGKLMVSKVYDGKTTTTVPNINGDLLVIDGLIEDYENVTLDLSDLVATFDDKNVGTNKNVTITGELKLSGEHGEEYFVVQPNFDGTKGDITKATLTAKASNISVPIGANMSSINVAHEYTIEGFANNETTLELEELPTAKLHSDINSTTLAGVYADKLLVEGGKAKNYKFDHIFGKVTVTDDVGDAYITFEPLTDKIYGDAPFDLVGSHLQGKEIYFTTSANDVVSVAKDGASWKATILKPGMVTLTAKYDGDNVVAEGSKSQTIAIAKAELTLTANDVSRNFNEANPSVVDAYTAKEWVKVEDKDLFNPAPTVSIDPQYTISTPAGEYPNAVIVTGASHPYYNITDKNGKLTILDIELKLIELRVNNERHEVGERYVVKKDYTGPSVTLEVIGTSNAVVNDLPATANVDKPSLQTIKFNLTNLSNTEKIEYEFEIEKRFQFEDLIIMRWNNVLTVINRPETTGFEYVAYQWYKNDEPINGANRQSYSASKEGQGLKDTDEYYVEVTDKATGKVLRCWEEKVDLREQNILAYPVPVRQQELITIEANVDEELLENATIAIFNSIGTKLSNHTVTGNITQVPAPAAAGFYILRLYGKDGFSKDFKIVVQ